MKNAPQGASFFLKIPYRGLVYPDKIPDYREVISKIAVLKSLFL
jgi:hypothetical protein